EQIRLATPVFNELSEDLDPAKTPTEDVRAQQSRADEVARHLNGARADYSRIVSDAPDRAKVEWRIEVLGELVETLEWGLERVKLPRMLRQAALRVSEAMPLYRRVAESTGEVADASERAALKTMQELALAKLKEARTLYLQAKSAAPDPEKVGSRIRTLDDLIETLETEPAPADAPALQREAAARIKEAMPHYQRYSDGTGSAEDGVKARGLLEEARSKYLRAQTALSGADADKVRGRIKQLDELIDALDPSLGPKK
ncbi:MAG TPA: hypothetical protein VMU54_08115, partial [Planctomycetota bacterium]|nr:hypothetical protein [Planctomycetota bacterium]